MYSPRNRCYAGYVLIVAVFSVYLYVKFYHILYETTKHYTYSTSRYVITIGLCNQCSQKE